MSAKNQQKEDLANIDFSSEGGENYAEGDILLIKEMADHGIMYGHKKNRTVSRFKPFIYTTRNGIEIIDLEKTLIHLEKASVFLKSQINENKNILLVGIQPASWEALKKFSEKYNFPVVKNKWIGGLLTNFKNIHQRIEYFKKLKTDIEKGLLDKYTKKERAMINRNLERMQEMFEGLENINKLPDTILIIDTSLKGHATALREAKRANIPVVAIIDSDDNPDLVDYAIPANDHTKMSIDWLINKIIEKIS